MRVDYNGKVYKTKADAYRVLAKYHTKRELLKILKATDMAIISLAHQTGVKYQQEPDVKAYRQRMQKAVNAVVAGEMTQTKASHVFNVNFGTLQNKLIAVHAHTSHDVRYAQMDKTLRNQSPDGKLNRRRQNRAVNTIPIQGVTFDRAREKFYAYISIDGKSISLGRYYSLSEALHARIKGELTYWGRTIDHQGHERIANDPEYQLDNMIRKYGKRHGNFRTT